MAQVINGTPIAPNRVARVRPLPLLDEQQLAERWVDKNLKRARTVGPFGENVIITPPMAQALLSRNPNNRKIVEAGVAQWANALKAGHWELNGETVIVASTGELNDGQHRLTAVVRTGISLHTFIVFGVARESRKTVDGGTKRTAGHVLNMAGISNGPLVASVAKIHINLRLRCGLGTQRSAKEIELELQRFPDLTDHRAASLRFAHQFRQSGGLMVAIHCVAHRKHGEKADEFFELLDSGIGLNDMKHPAFILRRRLTENLRNAAKLPMPQVAVLTIKAWNVYLKGNSATYLRWIKQSATPEAFPEIG